MKLEHADPRLERYIKQVVAAQMAEQLQKSSVDLEDAQAVASTLSQHRFGSQSIAFLIGEATEMAKINTTFTIVAALAFALFWLSPTDDSNEYAVARPPAYVERVDA